MKLLKIKSFCSVKSLDSLLKCRNQTFRLSNGYSTSSAPGDKSNKQPDFIETRSKLFDELKAEYDEKLKTFVVEPIKIKLNDGTVQEGQSWQSTPYQIYEKVNKKMATEAIVARVNNNQLWDLNRPLESDCELELLKFDDPVAEQVFWHSSAHVLGAAVELLYGSLLKTGPATETGFFYDVFDPEDKIHLKYREVIEREMGRITRLRHPFERIEVSKEDLMELFSYNRFKMEIIEKKIGDRGTVYRCGSLVDLCSGPHIKHTGKIKAFKLTHLGTNLSQDGTLKFRRLHGVAFPKGDSLKQWVADQEAAAKRDHRKIGRDHNLFFFHETSPGSCFFQPKGAFIYNTLQNFIRQEYRKREFEEVITPNIYKSQLWKISGHWEHFSENIFSFKNDRDEFALKPMNCPGHCLMFAHNIRSYRELPIRFADFGVLHRNETPGALTGLTRVRRFQQDDAHIFCTPKQIQNEIDSCLDFLSHVYGIFGFDFKLVLSTRPDSYLGDLDVWNKAETALENSLNKFGKPWKLNPGDGAFYGPKIDVTITDALKRAHQCATIQLDFLLPKRFQLEYDAEDDTKHTPVMIHRAIFGSLERFIAILTEHFAGRFPFFISPSQIAIIPVDPVFNEYAELMRSKLHNADFQVKADLNIRTKITRKIRDAQIEQFNFILVVGEKEKQTNTVNVRTRDGTIHGQFTIDDLIVRLNNLKTNFILNDSDFSKE